MRLDKEDISKLLIDPEPVVKNPYVGRFAKSNEDLNIVKFGYAAGQNTAYGMQNLYIGIATEPSTSDPYKYC